MTTPYQEFCCERSKSYEALSEEAERILECVGNGMFLGIPLAGETAMLFPWLPLIADRPLAEERGVSIKDCQQLIDSVFLVPLKKNGHLSEDMGWSAEGGGVWRDPTGARYAIWVCIS